MSEHTAEKDVGRVEGYRQGVAYMRGVGATTRREVLLWAGDEMKTAAELTESAHRRRALEWAAEWLVRAALDVTDGTGSGSTRHEGNEQSTDAVREEPPVPGVRAQGGGQDRGEPRDGLARLPLVRLGEHDHAADVGRAWIYGPEAACRFIAATSWPWERAENRDAWAVTMLDRPDLLASETEAARARLEAAIACVLPPGEGRA